ncbi:MAG: CAP domain-containing protein, partial [Myxococcota bacterium]
ELHEGLTDVALSHSQDMIANGFVGHTSPTTGSAPDRVQRSGYRSGLILENIGRGYGAQEIHRGLLASPGHRANILNRDVTHVGIGVASETEGQRQAFVATQVFIRMNRAVDLEAGAARLFRKINEGRAARGAEPLESEPNLTEAAQAAARSYFENPSQGQQVTVEDAVGSLSDFGMVFSRLSGAMVVAADVDAASRQEATFDPDLRYVGIGVAQGDRPDAPPNSVAIVILVAWPR